MAIGRKDYEDRIIQKKEYYEAKAEKFAKEAESRATSARETMQNIPLGQPILVGHHSEKRHRKDIERIDRNFGKSVEASEKSEYYANKAKNYGDSGAISQDDPEAMELLQAKIYKLEKERVVIKAIRKYHSKHKSFEGINIVLEKLDEETKQVIPNINFDSALTWYALPYLGKEINRLKKRVEQLKVIDAMEEMEFENNIGVAGIDNEINRVTVRLHNRNSNIEQTLKKRGFHWSPRNKQWQRLKNPKAFEIAKYILQEGEK